MTPEEFKQKAQAIYERNEGYGGEEGHMDMDDLMIECLSSLGYNEGLEILGRLTPIWYA